MDSEIFVDHVIHLWNVFCELQIFKSNKNLHLKKQF